MNHVDFVSGDAKPTHKGVCTHKFDHAGMALVVKHGAQCTSNMLSVFEGYLEAKEVADEASYDRVREGVVILLGTLAQHLDAKGPKVLLGRTHALSHT